MLSAVLSMSLALVAVPANAAVDASTLSMLTEGTTTASEIRDKYGVPKHEDRNPDGRFVYLYDISSPPRDMAGPTGEATVAFLFGSDEKLIRMLFYKL
jgi:hypothetical protein